MQFAWKGLFFAIILSLSVSLIPTYYSNLVFGYAKPVQYILPPRQQIADGVLPVNVVCPDDFVWIEKTSETFVACVNQNTAQKLSEQGWGKLLSQVEPQDQIFIPRENAIKLMVKHYLTYPSTEYSRVYTEFVFLKFNGTKNGSPLFTVNQSDPITKKFIPQEQTVLFDNESGKFSGKLIDTYAWQVTISSGFPGGSANYFVDAKSGEEIGWYNPCPRCL
jgi:hypothetical protein